MVLASIRTLGYRIPAAVLAVAVVGACAGSIAKAWSPSTPTVTASVFASLDYTNDMARDSAGNVYMVGQFTAPFDADPGSGTTNLTSAGNNDAYILKFDASGNLVWAHSVGGALMDEANGVAVDSSGNVYVTGSFEGTVDLDPSSSATANVTSAGAWDAFILKLDASGAYQWGHQIGGGSGNDLGQDVAVDSSGNPHFYGTSVTGADFDPGAGTVNLGGSATFILKMTPAGTYTWAGNLRSAGCSLTPYELAVDSAGSIVAAGSFNGGNCDFDPGSGTALLSSSSTDGFAVKLALASAAPNLPEYSWSRKVGGAGTDAATSIALASSGDVTIVGDFSGTVAFNPSDLSNPATLTAPSLGGGFVLNLSSLGAFQWVAGLTGTSVVSPKASGVDNSGNVYVGGFFLGSADFDPGAGTATVASAGALDAFIVKLNSSGTFVWVRTLASSGGESVHAMAVGPANGVLVAGQMYGSVDFDLESGTANLGSTGISGSYVMLISPTGATADTTTTSSTTSTTSSTSSTTSTVASSAAASTTISPASSTTAASATSSTALSTTISPASSTPAVPSAAATRLFAPKAIIIGDTEKVNQGDEIELSAGGFTASESVIVGFVGSPDNATTVTASATGKARATVEVPASATGRVTAYMYGTTSKKGFKQVFTLASLPATGRDAGSPLLAVIALALVGASVLMLRRRLSGD